MPIHKAANTLLHSQLLKRPTLHFPSRFDHLPRGRKPGLGRLGLPEGQVKAIIRLLQVLAQGALNTGSEKDSTNLEIAATACG